MRPKLNYLNLYNNIFTLRDKLTRDLSLQKHINDIKNRSPKRHESFYAFTPQQSLTTTITSLHSKTKANCSMNHQRQYTLQGNLFNARMKVFKLKKEDISRNNCYFDQRLKRISSPLSRKNFNESFTKFKTYKSICSKVKSNKDNQKKTNNILKKLPMIYIKGSKLCSY